MNRKWFHIYKIFKGRGNLNVRPGYKDSKGGAYINLWITEDEAVKIRNIHINHDYVQRSVYLSTDHILHEIYKLLPELFEY